MRPASGILVAGMRQCRMRLAPAVNRLLLNPGRPLALSTAGGRITSGMPILRQLRLWMRSLSTNRVSV